MRLAASACQKKKMRRGSTLPAAALFCRSWLFAELSENILKSAHPSASERI
jgi:hypothetical protein